MKKRLLVAFATGASVFALALLQAGGAQEPVVVSVSAESVGITITGGEIDFAGAFKPGDHVRAHPQESVKHADPALITNSGNVEINYIDIAYDGPVGQEAICDGGAGSWAAHASTIAQDRFFMRAWASADMTWGAFDSSAERISPTTGSGNILQVAPLAPDDSVPLLLHLRMPDPLVSGGEGCFISLSVTAATDLP